MTAPWTATDAYSYRIAPIHPIDAGGLACATFGCREPATHFVESQARDGMAIGISAQWMCEAHMVEIRDVMEGKGGKS